MEKVKGYFMPQLLMTNYINKILFHYRKNYLEKNKEEQEMFVRHLCPLARKYCEEN